MIPLKLDEDYWEDFELSGEDTEFLYNYLLEIETPLTPQELVSALVAERIKREKEILELQRTSGGDVYLPKETYSLAQTLIFPALNWKHGTVVGLRPSHNPELAEFQVIQVEFGDGELREFASGFSNHVLNDPPKTQVTEASLDSNSVLEDYGDLLIERLEDELQTNPGYVRIAGRWFPRALLVDINIGHLNLAEAVLDVAGGGPLPTAELVAQIGLAGSANQRLVEFSLDLALQEDARFDEVGPSGDVLWFLNRLEPPQVLEPPVFLRYPGIDHERLLLSKEMLALERELDDELSPLESRSATQEEVEMRLIFPHWRSGTLPLSSRLRPLFPTAYEAPRIRFMLVDGHSGEKFPGWVVREKRYVYGLQDWYKARGLAPGSLLRVKKSLVPGEVIISAEVRRPTREWIRTVLVGSDGGIVIAMLKQPVNAAYDERMGIAIPDMAALDEALARLHKERPPFEKIVVNMVRELAKLNPQSHVHASELYASVNIVRRCPPAPILSLLAGRPWFTHVGDMHFRFSEAEQNYP
jgi:hypothetical protein